MKGERNYHIFYRMLVGLPSDEKARLQLKQSTDYYYIPRVYLFLILPLQKVNFINQLLSTG